MRPPVDEGRLRELARSLGRVASAPTRIYLTGGATAVIEGWRGSTMDVDLRFEPDVDELLRELPALKERLSINIELASPPDCIPELPDWRERSPLVFQEGNVYVHHFDFYSQALAKIERGFNLDLEDVRRMIEDGLVDPIRLRDLYEAMSPTCIATRRSTRRCSVARWRRRSAERLGKGREGRGFRCSASVDRQV